VGGTDAFAKKWVGLGLQHGKKVPQLHKDEKGLVLPGQIEAERTNRDWLLSKEDVAWGELPVLTT